MDHPNSVPAQPAVAVELIQPWKELMQDNVESQKLHPETSNGGNHALRFEVNNQGVCTGAANGYGG
jgi:hypothetical protein